jgi:hypothetical protein
LRPAPDVFLIPPSSPPTPSRRQDASFIYETLAESCVRTNLRRFEARDYLFRAALCLMGAEMPEPELDEDKEDDEEELGYAIIAASEEKYHNIVWKV